MKKIVMTGGGTAGHVTPNIALFPALQKEGYEISYIGSYEGIEKRLIEEQGVPYYGISSGKLRRYFDPKNFSDPFKVLKGYHQSLCCFIHILLQLLRICYSRNYNKGTVFCQVFGAFRVFMPLFFYRKRQPEAPFYKTSGCFLCILPVFRFYEDFLKKIPLQ